VRSPEWWHSKVPMLTAIWLGISLTYGLDLYDLFPLLIWLPSAASFGFLLNDYTDRSADLQAGKINYTQHVPDAQLKSVLILFGIFSLLPWLLFSLYSILALAALQLLFFILYSVPPIRLRKFVVPALFLDAAYAFVIPVLIIVMLAGLYSRYDLLLWGAWALFAGLRNILQHHLADRRNDRKSGLTNLANLLNPAAAVKLINLFLIPELILGLQAYRLAGLDLEIIFVFFLLALLFNFICFTRYRPLFFFRGKLKSGSLSFNKVYEQWIPFGVILTNGINHPWIFLLVPIWLLLFRNELFIKLFHLSKVAATESYIFVAYRIFLSPIRLFYHHVVLRLIYAFLWPFRMGVNYGLYYFRRMVLGQSEQEARKLSDEEFRKFKAQQNAFVSNLEKSIPKEGTFSSEDMISNQIINGLWIGEELSRLELLSIQSFLDAGHRFRLWTYGPLRNKLPHGIEICDAGEIIPASKIFRYKYANSFGHGKGSVSGFSDVFRYKLLYEHGGWWVDMDVCCLSYFNVESPYFFRKHHDLPLVGNVMKVPPRSELMKRCFEEASATIDENNTDWHKPIEILNRHVFELGLEQYIRSGLGNEDRWDQVVRLIRGNPEIPAQWNFIHWMNEEWRSRKISKNHIRYRSRLGSMLIKAGLLSPPVSLRSKCVNDLLHAVYIPVYEYFSSD
jgi:4-hydroxybenzoate polyprenyltransferase